MDETKASRALEAAIAVFLRYGFRRTTMGDLAQAAGMSRPALYLLFCNKERIFEGAVRLLMDRTLDEVREAMAGPASPRDKLRLAFELWCVRPFSLMMDSPDARDLMEGGPARPALDQGYAAFEALLAGVLETLPPSPDRPGPGEIAHILASAVRGFKATARSGEELRALIEGLLKAVLPPPA